MSNPERNATTARGTNTGKPKSVRVLVVDDNPDMRAFIRIVLERAGFETEVAADGARALDLQREHPADVLITDIFMPEPDGLELIQQFRSKFPRTKVIAISGGGKFARADYLDVAREIGPEAVLHKPFTTETLVRTLQDVVAH
jgi:CheY-like chemotaxis protein